MTSLRKEEQLVDSLDPSLEERTVNLYDGEGKVCLIDLFPRLNPEGRNPELRAADVARKSYNTAPQSAKKDEGLVNYLCEHRHTSPLEHVSFTFYMEIPIFVARQVLRHRTGKYNELSLRYTPAIGHCNKYYKLSEGTNRLRGQSKINRQAGDQKLSDSELVPIKRICEEIEDHVQTIQTLYEKLLELGLAKEVARTYLPTGTYTHLYMTMDLHNLMHFLELRTSSDAQWEIQELANGILTLIEPHCPIAIKQLKQRFEPRFTMKEMFGIINGDKGLFESKSAKHEFERKKKLYEEYESNMG